LILLVPDKVADTDGREVFTSIPAGQATGPRVALVAEYLLAQPSIMARRELCERPGEDGKK
jgi:hypothetical protein